MKIAIQGHPTRGKEVIRILESLGGVNVCPLRGDSTFSYYYINYECYNAIHCHDVGYVNKYCKKYTLEEFEKEFPFKIGDEVTIRGLPYFPKVITKMVWDCDEILYSFEGLNNTWFGTKSLKKLKMKEERNITLTLDKAKEWYKKGGELKEIALQAFTEKELTKVELPKTWEEFCKNYPIEKGEFYITSLSELSESTCFRDRCAKEDKNVCLSQKSAEAHFAMIQLEQLRDCWRQGWEPNWNNGTQTKYCICCHRGEFKISILCETRYFLSFPTMKIAEEFLECFKGLIKQASDLI